MSIPAVNARGIPVRYAPRHKGGQKGVHHKELVNWAKRVQEGSQGIGLCGCGCGGRLIRTAQQVRKRFGYPLRFLPGHNSRKGCVASLDILEKSVILGSLLGDFSISFPHDSAAFPRLHFTHGAVQREYAMHKVQILRRLRWSCEDTISKGYKPGSILVVGRSSCQPVLSDIFDLVRPCRGAKTVTPAWIHELNSVSLAYWFMDDGSSTHSCGHLSTIAFHTEGFSEGENILLAAWFQSRGYPYVRVAHSRNRPYLYFPRAEAEHLVQEIRPHIFASVAYKIRGCNG